jgi:endonuclease/exonuclease/phosphatase (EEP) superfamily protein YafD
MALETTSVDRPSFFRRLLRFLERGLLLVTGSIGLGIWGVMLIRMLSDIHPAFEMATHASFHAFLGCLLLLCFLWVLYLLRRRSSTSSDRWRRRLIFVVIPLVYFFWVVEPWALIPLQSTKKAEDSIRVFAWNMLLVNEKPDEVLKFIEREKPDIIALIEVNPMMDQRLQALADKYPTKYSRAAWNAGGMLVLSRFPEAKFTSIQPGGFWMPAIEMSLQREGWKAPFRMLTVHTLSPKPTAGERTLVRNSQLDTISKWGADQANPAMVVGDFNISPWSPPFWRLLEGAKMSDSSRGYGYLPSFPAALGRLGIPIDYALYNREVEILSRSTLYEPHKSDHCPLVVDFRVKPSSTE